MAFEKFAVISIATIQRVYWNPETLVSQTKRVNIMNNAMTQKTAEKNESRHIQNRKVYTRPLSGE